MLIGYQDYIKTIEVCLILSSMGLKGNDEFHLKEGSKGNLDFCMGFKGNDEFHLKEGSKGNLDFCMGFKGNDEFPLFSLFSLFCFFFRQIFFGQIFFGQIFFRQNYYYCLLVLQHTLTVCCSQLEQFYNWA
jgi:hypothetical protein